MTSLREVLTSSSVRSPLLFSFLKQSSLSKTFSSTRCEDPVKIFFLLTICILIVTGCDYDIVSYYPEKGKGNEASEKGEETVETDKGPSPDRSDSLFVLVETEEKRYVFETSNNKYLSEEGYTLWSVKNTKQASSWRVSVSKEAGNSKAGYGILFCGESKDGADTFYTFLNFGL